MYGEPVLMFRYKDGKTVADQTDPPISHSLVTHRAAAGRKQWFKATVDGRNDGEPFYQCFEFESGVWPNPGPHDKSWEPELTRQKVDVIHLKKDWHAVNGAKD